MFMQTSSLAAPLTKPNTPITIKMFFQVGWIIVGLSIVMTSYGLIKLILYEPGDYDTFDGQWMVSYLGVGEEFSFMGYLWFVRDMMFFGTFPGFVLVGLGYHLKKTWESTHYPW